jgi:chromosome segregation ATPase
MKNIINILLLILVVLTGCKMKKSDEQEIQKLLDRQTQIQESREESVERLVNIKDSLAGERQLLMEQRAKKDQKVKALQENQQRLVDRLKGEEESVITREKAELQGKISRYDDSIEQVINELQRLDADIDSIEKNMGLYELQEGQAEKILSTGISEIDQRITKLENQKQQEIKNADLLKRRIRIAGKKIEAYEMERQIYREKQDELLRMNASEEDLSPFRKRVAEMDSIIGAEEANRRSIEGELDRSRQWIADAEDNIKDLREKIRQEHDKKEIIEGFIASEKQRLKDEITGLQSARERLVSEQEQISDELSAIQERIALLDKKSELIRSRDMSDILEQQAALEKTEADLADEEVRLREESSKIDLGSPVTATDSAGEDLKSLLLLSSQLDSLRVSIQQEKMEIARTRMELSEKRAEAASQRARFGRTMASIVIVLILGGMGLLTLFYYLGKRARKSS